MTGAVHPKPQRLRPAVPAVLALGANLGDREATIRAAVAALDAVPGIRVERLSSLYETPALKVDGVDHDAPAYLNAVTGIRTTLGPTALLDAVNAVENDFGRVRDERWGDRTLDVDIVDFDGRQSHDERLTLPHPRAAERAFVLVPWLDVDPDAVLPGQGAVAELAARATDTVTLYAPAADQGDPA
ncbi:2-amino-4-hydroxy-6-hydroxymethyldihydropteridine diphosphokinase [Leifsonia poae]|uniref:2-amino-4-hydroxy-6- hydroxymethyldihydropteridine diphosphokinase n=1 Tax=Leifsonia poae TaxID=110933 RepID=UPI001CBD01AE|nr:2-amino-4-hydroxy-6-hydroxymethyldihydropteridine diphosphokinase [Leifsonia poae]